MKYHLDVDFFLRINNGQKYKSLSVETVLVLDRSFYRHHKIKRPSLDRLERNTIYVRTLEVKIKIRNPYTDDNVSRRVISLARIDMEKSRLNRFQYLGSNSLNHRREFISSESSKINRRSCAAINRRLIVAIVSRS